MALSALALHQALHGFAVDPDAFPVQPCPDHAIAQIRLQVDESLDALRHHFVDLGLPGPRLVIGGAAGNSEDPTDSGERSSKGADESGGICSSKAKGRMASLRISLSITNSPILACSFLISARYCASIPLRLSLSASTP